MTAITKPQTVVADAKSSGLTIDRTTGIGIGTLIAGVLILIALIALITYLPSQTIARIITTQASESQRILAQSLSRQTEDYLNNITYDLLGLANRPEIKGSGMMWHVPAMTLIANEGQLRAGQIKSVVRLSENGQPLYAWPDSYNQRISAGQALPWTVDQNWVTQVVQGGVVQFRKVPLTAGGAAYLLVVPVAPYDVTNLNNEAIAIEVDLDNYFKTNFASLQLSPSTQLWVFDNTGAEVYQYREAPVFNGDLSQVPQQNDAVNLSQFPTSDRETSAAPVYAAFTRGQQGGNRAFTILLSHATAEAQAAATDTLRTFFLIGLAVVLVVVIAGVFIGWFLLRENNNRRVDAQRRSTARTLLTTARALNSSLELHRVLDLILGELGSILPHDSASILMVDEDDQTFAVAAESGVETSDGQSAFPFSALRGAREVVKSGKPVVINDTLADLRWQETPGSKIRSWLGVPLRVRDQSVGVLSIDSFMPERFLPDDIDFAEAFAGQAGVAIQNARSHEFQIRTYETELETARLIQTSLLPQEAPPLGEIEMASRSIPARQVSGDYYQYYMLPDGRLGVAVGDVSGKGIPAALLMAVITTALREEIFRTPAPAELLNELNARLVERMQQNNMNSALLMSVFDPHSRDVEIANGGMVQPYLRNGSGWENVQVGGYPLGAAARSKYQAKTVHMPPDSMLVFVSDGVVESQNRKAEMFGFERLEALLQKLPKDYRPEQLADDILAAVHEHLEGQDPQDDITVVVMKSVITPVSERVNELRKDSSGG